MNVEGSALVVLHKKLYYMRRALKNWNWEVFGDVRRKIEQNQDKVMQLDFSLQQQWDEQVSGQLKIARKELHQVLSWEAEMMQQKARITWLHDGDRNTAFFHASIRERLQRDRMKLKLQDGSWCTNNARIGEMAVEYFADQFAWQDHVINEELFRNFPSSVSMEDNDMSTKVPDMQEVWNAVKDLNPDSSPGVDGFTGQFYQGCWHTIKEDVHRAVSDFFTGQKLERGITSTAIVLIPKIKTPTVLSDWRPICLCTFACKIISKILATRLSKLLPKLISLEQAGFVKDRSIQENVGIAQEMISHIDKKCRGGNLVLKLDMSKAYDRVEWDFLLRAMQAMGFNQKCMDMVLRLLNNTWYTMKANDENQGFFKSSRGVQQGDPLSPLLFIITQEILSFNVRRAVDEGRIAGYNCGRDTLAISHLFYADDSLFFCNGGRKSVRNMKELLKTYEDSSGQLVSLNKSGFYTSSKCTNRRRDTLAAWTGMAHKEFPMKYLGVPLFKGHVKRIYFDKLEQKIINHIEGWKGKLLSFGGRICLLKSILASIPIYTMSRIRVPKSLLKRIESHMAIFLWNNAGETRSLSWKRICKPFKEAGLGLRPMNEMMRALHAKLAWSILKGLSLWAKFMTRKYKKEWGILQHHALIPYGMRFFRKLKMFRRIANGLLGLEMYHFGMIIGAACVRVQDQWM